jgi:murein L,D-transpeptidase YafK
MRALIIMLAIFQAATFKSDQLKQSRVKTAYDQKEDAVKEYFKTKNLVYSGFHLFLRAFKKEEKLEVWVKEKNKDTYSLLHVYDFCTSSGTLGPKRREGDSQIPEGAYHINHFNPQSNFYLSLGLSYPNASDKILSDKKHPGGAIYIHGSCVTIGCIPITDDKIKELYVLAVEARANGQEKIPVHVFPTKLTQAGLTDLKKINAQHITFWSNLKVIFDDFEQTKQLRATRVNGQGEYYF